MTLELQEIKDIRKRLGLTQVQLAKKANVSQSLIAKIESGIIDPTYSNAQKIFSALNDLSKQHEMTAEEVMQKKLIFVQSNDDLKKAIELMKKHEISQMPVIDDGNLAGLVSESTILDSIMKGRTGSKVKDVMQDSPPSVSKKTSINVVSNLLKFFSMVIVSEKGHYIGLITKADLINKLYGK